MRSSACAQFVTCFITTILIWTHAPIVYYMLYNIITHHIVYGWTIGKRIKNPYIYTAERVVKINKNTNCLKKPMRKFVRNNMGERRSKNASVATAVARTRNVYISYTRLYTYIPIYNMYIVIKTNVTRFYSSLGLCGGKGYIFAASDRRFWL